MESEMDNKEWLNDFEALKQVNSDNPFTVPSGYFDELHQNTMSRAFLDGIDTEGKGFTIPENYFDELQGNIQSRVNIETVANNTSTGFAVPENYFEELQSNIQSRVNIEEALHHTTGDFVVPENYFDDLQQQVTARIAVEEILNGQPEGFTVPDNYFEQLQHAVINKTVNGQQQKQRKGIVRRLVTSGVFKYATAACLAIAVGVTWFVEQYESPQAVHKRSYIHKALSNVSDEDIIDYLQMHMDAADTRSVLDNADQINSGSESTEELKDYLSTH